MANFILKETYGDIIYAAPITYITINDHIEKDKGNFRVAHLKIDTKQKSFIFRVCDDERQGNDLDAMINRIQEHFNMCIQNEYDYIITDENGRQYIYITDTNKDKRYYEQYTGSLL